VLPAVLLPEPGPALLKDALLTSKGDEACRISGNRRSTRESSEVNISGNRSLRDGGALHNVCVSIKAISYPKCILWVWE
jgi:hypothetical protein